MQTAIQTADIIRTIISSSKQLSVKEIINLVRFTGQLLTAAGPVELVIGNIVRRVLFIIRLESAAVYKHNANHSSSTNSKSNKSSDKSHMDARVDVSKDPANYEKEEVNNVDMSASLHKLFEANNQVDYNIEINEIKKSIIEEIGQLIEEIKGSGGYIAAEAKSHIFPRQSVLVYAMSKTIVAFLKEAAKSRSFDVYVVESAPRFGGHKMAIELTKSLNEKSKDNLKVTVITDAAVFAVMGNISKVFIGAQAVLANGGVLATTGASNICWAAKYHKVPVLVLTGLHKLCPLYAFDQNTFNEQGAPSDLLQFGHDFEGQVEIENAAFDYVPPDLVSLFVTNLGAHLPTYIYRLLSEYYFVEDYTLEMPKDK
jgi:translation initiation factor eIF-2B subunit beta